jgi:hypothetical protein
MVKVGKDMREIVFRQMHKETEWFKSPDTFRFNERSKHHWLQKLCLRILARLNCHVMEETYKVVRLSLAPPDREAIANAILQQRELLDYDYNLRAAYVLMGSKEFKDIARQKHDSLNMFAFDVTLRNQFRYFDCEVRVIPWMSGILVMPKEALQ